MPSFENKRLTPSHIGHMKNLRTDTFSAVEVGQVFTKKELDNCVFEWSELAGKTLSIRVDKVISDGMTVETVIGVSEDGHVYVLYQGPHVSMERSCTS